MLRAFSKKAEDLEFQKKFSEVLGEANDKGSAELKDDSTDLELNKTDDGIEIKDKLNGETTIATENPEDDNDVVLTAKEEEAPKDNNDAPASEDSKVTISEVTPDEEYKLECGKETFSVKGSLKKAINVAKKFSQNICFSDFPENDFKPEGSNIEPEKNNPATVGVVDPEKTGMPGNRSFAETIEDVKEAAEEDPDGAIMNVEDAQTGDSTYYHCQKTDKGFSWKKLDKKTMQYSSIPEDDIVAELSGTNMEPEQQVRDDKGIEDPEKNGLETATFAEALEKAEESVEETGEPALVNDPNTDTIVQVEKSDDKEKKFSYYLVDTKDKTFSETTKGDLMKETSDPESTPSVEEQVSDLEDKADEVAKDPTSDNAQELKKQADSLAEEVEKSESFSEFKKKSLLGRLKAFSDLVEEKPAEEKKDETKPEETPEGEDKSFSDLLELNTPYKVFAEKSDVEKAQASATRQFSQVEGEYDPCLDAQF